MNLNTCNIIQRIEQVLAELDNSAIEEYVIIIIICVGVVTLRFRTVPPHGSSNKTRVNRAMPHHSIEVNFYN